MSELTLKSPGIEFFETDFAPSIAKNPVSPAAIVINSSWGPVNKITYCTNKRDLFRKFGLATSLNTGKYLALAETFLDYADGLYVVRALAPSNSADASSIGKIATDTGTSIAYDHSMGTNPTEYLADLSGHFFTAKYPGSMGNALRVFIYSYEGASKILYGEIQNIESAKVLAQITSNLGITNNALLNMFGYSASSAETRSTQKWLVVITDNGNYPNSFDSLPNLGVQTVREYAFVTPEYSNSLTSGSYPAYANFFNENFTLLVANRGTIGQPGPLGTYDQTTGTWQYSYKAWSMSGGSDTPDESDATITAIGKAYDYLSTDNNLYETIVGPIYNTLSTSRTTAIPFPPPEAPGLGHDPMAWAVSKAMYVSISKKKSITVITAPKNLLVNGSSNEAQILVDGLIGTGGALSNYKDYTYAFMETGWIDRTTKYATNINGFKYLLPMCAMTCGLISYNKLNYNIWSASAGYIRGLYKDGIKLLTPQLKNSRDVLFPASINPIIEDEGKILLFGNKTLSPDNTGSLSRIEVRLLMLRIQKTVEDFAKTFLFESNDASTRSRFKYLVDQYLGNLKTSGGIQDFFIRLDESNNTPSIIDANRLIVSIAVKPQKSINFITINYNIVNSAMSVQEV